MYKNVILDIMFVVVNRICCINVWNMDRIYFDINGFTQNMDYLTMEYETLGKYKEEPQKLQRRNLGLACVAC